LAPSAGRNAITPATAKTARLAAKIEFKRMDGILLALTIESRSNDANSKGNVSPFYYPRKGLG
jgi:hypothetical protein